MPRRSVQVRFADDGGLQCSFPSLRAVIEAYGDALTSIDQKLDLSLGSTVIGQLGINSRKPVRCQALKEGACT